MLVSTAVLKFLLQLVHARIPRATKSRLGGRLEGLGMDAELLFELHGPEGQIWRLYLDGRVEGFPAGTLVVNRCLPAVARAAGESLTPADLSQREQHKLREYEATWMDSCRRLLAGSRPSVPQSCGPRTQPLMATEQHLRAHLGSRVAVSARRFLAACTRRLQGR